MFQKFTKAEQNLAERFAGKCAGDREAARFILQKRQVEVLEKIGERLEKMGKEMNNATIIMSDMVRKLNDIAK